MKSIFKITIFLLSVSFISFSCEEDETDNVSFVTTYHVITLKDQQIKSVELGTPYVEPGVDVTLAGQPTEFETSGEVDHTTPGLYPVTYSVTNSDGFSRSATRQVVVYDPATDAIDLSGQYKRAATGVIVNVTKIGPSTYHIDDAAGFGSSFLDVTFIHVQGDELVIPSQIAPSSGITVNSVVNSAYITDTGFTWVLNASSAYGLAVREFTKL